MREVRKPHGVTTIQLSDGEAQERGTSAENPKADAPLSKARSRADEARAAAAKSAFSRED